MVFVDRKAKYPGRWTMKKEDGTSEIVTLIRNDEPEVEGTPMNAATLNELSDVAGADVARVKAEAAEANAKLSEANAKASATQADTSQKKAAENQQAAEDAANRAAAIVSVDKTLSVEGAPADAKAVGERFNAIHTDWDSIEDKPEEFPPSAHTHSKNDITDFPSSLPANGGTATNAECIGNDNAYMRFHWNGQSGQPTWLFGSNDGSDSYVWNPSNFNVNYANGSGNVQGFWITAQSSDPGAGSTLNSNQVVLVYE